MVWLVTSGMTSWWRWRSLHWCVLTGWYLTSIVISLCSILQSNIIWLLLEYAAVKRKSKIANLQGLVSHQAKHRFLWRVCILELNFCCWLFDLKIYRTRVLSRTLLRQLKVDQRKNAARRTRLQSAHSRTAVSEKTHKVIIVGVSSREDPIMGDNLSAFQSGNAWFNP